MLKIAKLYMHVLVAAVLFSSIQMCAMVDEVAPRESTTATSKPLSVRMKEWANDKVSRIKQWANDRVSTINRFLVNRKLLKQSPTVTAKFEAAAGEPAERSVSDQETDGTRDIVDAPPAETGYKTRSEQRRALADQLNQLTPEEIAQELAKMNNMDASEILSIMNSAKVLEFMRYLDTINPEQRQALFLLLDDQQRDAINASAATQSVPAGESEPRWW